MNLRCPYCHTTAPRPTVHCRACLAPAHPACALELAHCAACGDSRWEGLAAEACPEWGRVEGPDGPTFLRATLTALDVPLPQRSVRLDLQRRAEPTCGLLAGTAWLSLPRGEDRPALDLVWLLPERRWLRRRWRTARRVPLLSAHPGLARPEPAWRHQIEFRTTVPPRADARLALDLGGQLRLSLPFGVQAGRASRQVAG